MMTSLLFSPLILLFSILRACFIFADGAEDDARRRAHADDSEREMMFSSYFYVFFSFFWRDVFAHDIGRLRYFLFR